MWKIPLFFFPVPSLPFLSQVPLMNGQMGPSGRPQMSQTPMARHPSREQLIDYLMLKVSHQGQAPPRIPQDTVQHEVSKVKVPLKVPQCPLWCPCMWLRRECVGVFQIHVKVEKNPELGFSISGGVGGRGNPFHPDDNVNMWNLFFAFINICNISKHFYFVGFTHHYLIFRVYLWPGFNLRARHLRSFNLEIK